MRWVTRQPLLLFALPVFLFEANAPAFDPLFALPPRMNHGLDESTKFELSEPQDWLFDDTD